MDELKLLLQEVTDGICLVLQPSKFPMHKKCAVADGTTPTNHLQMRSLLILPHSSRLEPFKRWSTESTPKCPTTNGTSLYQNWLLAQKMGMEFQMARRQPGAAIPLPAMAHWKMEHFSAITKMVDGRYVIEDPTFTQALVSPKVLDKESDGYFLIPDGPLPAGWSPVSELEAQTIWGKSTPTSGDPDSPTLLTTATMEWPDVSGMMRISLTLSDTPLAYTPPRGPQVQFEVTYAERSINQSGSVSHSNLGDQWGFEWLKYISDDTTQTNAAR